MSTCEMCGKKAESLKKAKIEGAVLKVCGSCAKIGEEVSSGGSRKKKKKKKKSRRSRKRRSKEVLVPKYGEKLKKAREDEKLSIKEVADDLNEKQSLISKIEKEDLKPDKALANKISEKFGLKLYTNPEVSDYGSNKKVNNEKATLGDVADVN